MIAVDELGAVERTALLTVYARALDARSVVPILGDQWACRVVGAVAADFGDLGVTPSVAALVSLRAKMLDTRTRAFIANHGDAVVVDLGAGLSSAVFRVDPPASVDWYSVDLPGVTELREALGMHRPGAHLVAASVAEPDWTAAIPAERPTMVVADGLFAFLSEPVIVTLIGRITNHFGTGTVAFNDYGKVGRINRLAGQLAMRGGNSPHRQWDFPGFTHASYPESWNPRLRLVEEASAMLEPDAAHFPAGLRLASRLATRIPSIARKARILSYRF